MFSKRSVAETLRNVKIRIESCQCEIWSGHVPIEKWNCCRYRGSDSVNNFEGKPYAIFEAATVLIRALVRVVLLQYHQYYDL